MCFPRANPGRALSGRAVYVEDLFGWHCFDLLVECNERTEVRVPYCLLFAWTNEDMVRYMCKTGDMSRLKYIPEE